MCLFQQHTHVNGDLRDLNAKAHVACPRWVLELWFGRCGRHIVVVWIVFFLRQGDGAVVASGASGVRCVLVGLRLLCSGLLLLWSRLLLVLLPGSKYRSERRG